MKIEDLYPKKRTIKDKIIYIAKLKTKNKFFSPTIKNVIIGKKFVVVKLRYGNIIWDKKDIMKELSKGTNLI